jgi:hypothetical protein
MPDPAQEAEELLAALQQVAARPGMWALHEDYHQAVAFVAGLQTARPEVFEHLREWAVARLRGARDKHGWAGALGVLAAAKVAEEEPPSSGTPHVTAFLNLVCDYLEERRDPQSPGRMQARYEEERREYEAGDAAAHAASGIEDPWSPDWEQVCWEWQLTYIPQLAYSPDPSDPWAKR